MDKNTLNKCRVMKFNSFEYIDEDELNDVSIFHETESCCIFYKEAEDRYHIYWATDSEAELSDGLSSMIDNHHGKSLYIEFVTDSLAKRLKTIGFEVYSEYADFWNIQLKSDPVDFGSSDIVVREASVSEFPLLAQITLDCKGQSRGFDGESAEFLEEWFDSGNSTILVAEVEGSAVGLVLLNLYGFDSEKGTVLWVRLLAVAPEYQRKGIGRRLLSLALDWGAGNGAVRAFLHADIHNDNAVKLYRDKGFVMKEQGTQLNMIRKSR